MSTYPAHLRLAIFKNKQDGHSRQRFFILIKYFADDAPRYRSLSHFQFNSAKDST